MTFVNGPRTPAAADVVCLPLPVTGFSLAGVLGVALVLALVGALLLIAGRRGRRARSAALLAGAFLLPAPLLLAQSQPAAAAASVICPPGTYPAPAPPGPNQQGVPTEPLGPAALSGPTGPTGPTSPTGTVRVTVVQTSVNTEMAPGVAPTTLVGEVTNPSRETVYVTDVVVAVTAVTKARNAVSGPCGPSDYRLTGRRMPVDAVLEPGRKATFFGARIGFVNKSVNQDACKGATVSLGYTSS